MKQYDLGFDMDHTLTAGFIPDGKSAIVITGRGPEQKKNTEAELEKMGLKIPVLYFPYGFALGSDPAQRDQLIGEFKAKMVKKLGIKTYYEDRERQVEIIKELNPDVNVVLVKETKEEKRLKYILFSYENVMAGSIAYQLQREGAVVNFAEVKDVFETLTDEEQKHHTSSHSEYDDRRLTLFEGIINKMDADKVLAVCEDLPNKDDYFIFTDKNDCFRYTEKLLKMGFTKGTFPTQEDRLLEVERDKAKEIVKQHYPGVKVKDYKTFKTIDEGIQYITEAQDAYVLKSLGDSGETVVPKTCDLEINKKEIIAALTNNKKDYEEGGFLLEQKIMDGAEITPEAFFWNGEMVFCDMDLEVKTTGGQESGGNVGCGLNIIIRTDPQDKVNKIAFPPYVLEQMKDKPGMRMIDIAMIIDPKDGQLYFLEFCPNRVGWDSFPTQCTMAGGASKFFEYVVKGENPLKTLYGTAARMFNDTLDKDRYPAEGIGMIWKEEIDEYVYPYDIKAPKIEKKKDEEEKEPIKKFVTAGAVRDAAVLTCAYDGLLSAIKMVYDYVKQFSLKDMQYRSQDDFLSFSYPQAILNRLDYLLKLGLIKNDKIKSEVEQIKQMKLKDFQYHYGKNNDKNDSAQ